MKGCKCAKKCKEKLYLRVMFGVTHKSRVKEILKRIKFYDLYPIFLFDFAKKLLTFIGSQNILIM